MSARNRLTRTRVFWTTEETRKLLEIIGDMKVAGKLDSKRQRNIDLFQNISFRLGATKTAEQTRSRWKYLKKSYRHEVKFLNSDDQAGTNESLLTEHFDLLDALLGNGRLQPRPTKTPQPKPNCSLSEVIDSLGNTDDTADPNVSAAESKTEEESTVNNGCDEIDQFNQSCLKVAEGSQLVTVDASPSDIQLRKPAKKLSKPGSSSDTSSNTSSDAASRSKCRKRRFAATMKPEAFIQMFAETQERLLMKVIRQHQTWASQELQRQREWETTMFTNSSNALKETVNSMFCKD